MSLISTGKSHSGYYYWSPSMFANYCEDSFLYRMEMELTVSVADQV